MHREDIFPQYNILTKTINLPIYSTNLGKPIKVSNDLWYDF